MKEIENYFKICNESNKNDLKISKIKEFPKVSIISAVYNKSGYLLRFLKSIQNQNFNDIEIILIDDFSSDNTVNLIKQFQSRDKRIILIQNKKNYGTFKSRNLGILKSTGEFVILPDPDDILSKNSLKTFYLYAIKYGYEMLRFNLYIGGNHIFVSSYVDQTPSRPVFQPELQTFLFYATGKLMQIDFNVSNKFIKREALIRSLNTLSKKYLNMYMTICEDGVLNYILHRNVRSFYFLKKIGYYYIKNPNSITEKEFHSNTIKFNFILLKVVFEFSKNNLFEKDMFNFLFEGYIIEKFVLEKLEFMKDNLKFYFKAINMFLKNKFVSINNKKYLNKLKEGLFKVS